MYEKEKQLKTKEQKEKVFVFKILRALSYIFFFVNFNMKFFK